MSNVAKNGWPARCGRLRIIPWLGATEVRRGHDEALVRLCVTLVERAVATIDDIDALKVFE